MTTIRPSARLLMCRPEHFAVSYVINPWMDPQSWARDRRAQARRVPANGRRFIASSSSSAPPSSGHAGSGPARSGVHRQRGGGARSPGAAGALPPSRAPARGAALRSGVPGSASARCHRCIRNLPDDLVLEGAGDCVWDESRKLFWLGYGPRSDAAAQQPVADMFGQEVVALELADPRFYHMDTALAPLPGGEVMYLPQAFSRRRSAKSASGSAPDARIELGLADGCRLAANAVCLGRTLVLSDCSDACGASSRNAAIASRRRRCIVSAQRRRGLLPDAAPRPPLGCAPGARRRCACVRRAGAGMMFARLRRAQPILRIVGFERRHRRPLRLYLSLSDETPHRPPTSRRPR